MLDGDDRNDLRSALTTAPDSAPGSEPDSAPDSEPNRSAAFVVRARRLAAALDNRRWAVAAAVLVFSLALRLLFIAQTHDVPQIRTPTPGLDIQIGWEAARGLRGEAPTNPSFELMMLSAPFYPHLLAAQQSVLGEDMIRHRVFSAVVSSLRFVLLLFVMIRLGQSVWSAAAGVCMLAALPSLIYFDTVLLKAATDLSILTLLLFAAVSWERATSLPRTLARALLSAGLLGCALLSQLNTFLYVVPIVAFAATNRGWPRLQRAAFAATTVVALGAIAATFLLRDPDAAGTSARFIPRAGVDVRMGFQPTATGVYSPIPGIAPWLYGHAFESRMILEADTGERTSWKQADQHYRDLARSYVRDNPGAAARLVVKKASYAVNDYEIRGTDYLPYIETFAPVLGWSPISYGWLFILGAVGTLALVRQRRWRRLVLLGGIFGAVLAANCLAIVEWRFRLATVIPLAVLASVGIAHLVSAAIRLGDPSVRGPSLRRLALAAVVLLAAGWLTFRPILAEMHPRYMQMAADNHEISKRAEGAAAKLRGVDEQRRRFPDDPSLKEQRMRLLLQLWRQSEAFAILKELTASGEASEWAEMQYIRALLWISQYETARDYLATIRQRDPARLDRVVDQLDHLERKVVLGLGLAYGGPAPAGR